jgi:hypothetical protein
MYYGLLAWVAEDVVLATIVNPERHRPPNCPVYRESMADEGRSGSLA